AGAAGLLLLRQLLQLFFLLLELLVEELLAVLEGDVAVELGEVVAVALAEEHLDGGGELLGVVEVEQQNLLVGLVDELEAQVAVDVDEVGENLDSIDVGERGLLGGGHVQSFPWGLPLW